MLDITVTKTVGLADLSLVIPSGKTKLVKRVIGAADLKRLQESTFEGVEQVEQVVEVDPEVVKAVEKVEVAAVSYNDQKSMDALTRFAEAIKQAIAANGGEPLKWKKSVIEKATGITAQTWRSQSEKVDELLDAGLEIVKIEGNRKGRTQTIVRRLAA